MVELVITVEGNYSEDQIRQAMTILGELVINRIKEFIRQLDLIQTGDYLQHWMSSYKGNVLTIENSREYALYLEYGTYGYYDKHGEDTFTDPSDPKKRDLPAELRSAYPKGMQAFAPIRRVLYNENIMSGLVAEAFSQV